MGNFKNDKRGGFYWKGDRPYASVTQILRVIDKPALRYWFGREVYRAMVVNPTLGEAEALAMPYKISDTAKSRGSTVHSIVEVYKKGSVDFDEWLKTIVPDFQGYARAFDKWVKEMKINIQDQERSVFSEKYQYAGTCDMLAILGDDTLPTVIDVKTGKDIYMEAYIQTSAYRQAIEESGSKCQGIGVLLLMEDGSYKYHSGGNKFETFLACKTLWEGLNEEMLVKIGYKLK